MSAKPTETVEALVETIRLALDENEVPILRRHNASALAALSVLAGKGETYEKALTRIANRKAADKWYAESIARAALVSGPSPETTKETQ